MLTKSSLLPLVVMEPVEAGMRQHAVFRHQAAAVTCAIIRPGFQARVAGQERRQLLVERGVHQAVDAALGNARQRGQRDRQKIELERQRLAVKIAAGENLVAEYQRVIGGGVQLDGENPAALRPARRAPRREPAERSAANRRPARGRSAMCDWRISLPSSRRAQARGARQSARDAGGPRGCARRRRAACRAARRASWRRPRRRFRPVSRRLPVPGSRSPAWPACR